MVVVREAHRQQKRHHRRNQHILLKENHFTKEILLGDPYHNEEKVSRPRCLFVGERFGGIRECFQQNPGIMRGQF